MKRILRFAGIGPRDTPQHVLEGMAEIGRQLALMGWNCVSGYADGADTAWMSQVPVRQQEIWLPWRGYNGAPHNDPRFQSTSVHHELMAVAQKHYRGDWTKLSTGAQLLFARNVNIMAGAELDVAVDMCCYWQSEAKEHSDYGGTNHAVRVAKDAGIQCFNIRKTEDQEAMGLFVDALMEANK